MTNEYQGLNNTRPEGTFVQILGSDGSLRLVVPEGTPGAVRREYEVKNDEGVETKKVKHELVFNELEGDIENIYFKDGKFGQTLNITIRNGESLYILSINTANNFASDIMKKLPNVNLEVPVMFRPYAFPDEGTKKGRKGVSIQQAGEKVLSFFWDPEAGEKGAICNDFPEVDEDKKPEPGTTKWKKFWGSYFSDIEDFLVENTTKEVISNLPEKETKTPEESEEVEKEEKDPLDNF